MIFTSIEYLVFFTVVAILYFVIPQKFRWLLLLAASCFFYMSLVPYYIIFVLVIVINDYSAAICIGKYRSRKRLFLYQSILVNLGMLFVFKYFNFFGGIAASLSALAGLGFSVPVLKILLPVGLSFYTFKSLGYVIDVYREEQIPEKHIGHYALYVLLFLEILSGPIDRGKTLLPQFNEEHKFDYSRISSGLKLAAWGVFKKVVIADKIALIINQVYGDVNHYSGTPLIITALLYSFQIYFDFSGYTDIALGCGKILGLNLPENFDLPLISRSITEFWRRWHISLSNWLKDYLYNPIAISTRSWGKTSVVFSLFVTFLLAGIWHGAGWTFVIFGALHGGALVYEFLTRNIRKKLFRKIPAFIYDGICNIIAFSYLSFAFIFFRSADLAQAGYFITHLFVNVNLKLGGYTMGLGKFETITMLVLIVFAMFAEIYTSRKEGLVKFISAKPVIVRWGFYYAIVLLVLCFGEFGVSTFLYFKF